MAVCSSCGKELPGEFPFCPFCGAALMAAPPGLVHEERKVVTVLFADLVGFTTRAAPVDGVLVDRTTYRATGQAIEYRERAPVEAKGKAEPIEVWEPLQARSRFGVDVVQTGAPLVGRERELDALRDALERARQEHS